MVADLHLGPYGQKIGFPLCLAISLTQTDASHAGLVLAILPLLTAILGSRMQKEKHGYLFWITATTGCVTVLCYIVWKNNISFSPADGWLLVAALFAAMSILVAGQIYLSKKMA